MIYLSFVAALLLPIAAAYCRRVSIMCAVALAVASIGSGYWLASIVLGSLPWDGARWICAGVTGLVGAAALGSRVRLVASWRGVLSSRGAWCEGLLVGSAIADFVCLYREAHGAEFGALPLFAIVALLAMIAAARKASLASP